RRFRGNRFEENEESSCLASVLFNNTIAPYQNGALCSLCEMAHLHFVPICSCRIRLPIMLKFGADVSDREGKKSAAPRRARQAIQFRQIFVRAGCDVERLQGHTEDEHTGAREWSGLRLDLREHL